MKITEDQKNILINSSIEGNRFYLPGQLNPKDYKKINEILESIGLSWNRKEKAHIIDGDNEELINLVNNMIETGETKTLKEIRDEFQFFPTPSNIAKYIVELANLKSSDSVLEPSAGKGNISDEILKYDILNLTNIELMEDNYMFISDKYKDLFNVQNYNMDFLNFDGGTYDKIIMNPPFTKSQDVKHILHAYNLLNKEGMLVSIASSGIEYRDGKLYEELRLLNTKIINLDEKSFKESGTNVSTCIVILTK